MENKLLPLAVGVSIFSLLLVLSAFAWTEPTMDPPSANIGAFVNLGSTAQTKAGALTVTTLTVSEAKLYLDDTVEGDIYNADQIIGYNDLRLCRSSSQCATEVSDADLWIDSAGKVYVLNEAFVVGKVGNAACLKLRDTDNSGWTYCTVLNGVMSCSTTSCE